MYVTIIYAMAYGDRYVHSIVFGWAHKLPVFGLCKLEIMLSRTTIFDVTLMAISHRHSISKTTYYNLRMCNFAAHVSLFPHHSR